MAVLEQAASARKGERRFDFRLESLLVLLVLAAAMSILSPYFLSFANFVNILQATAVIGVLAIGATFVICSAGIDLSLGSVMAFAGIVGAMAMNKLGLPTAAGVVGCLAAGALAGAISGLLITRARIPAFIATLGMLSIARGAALVLSSGKPVYGLPAPFVFFGQGRPFGELGLEGPLANVPTPVIIFLVVACVAHYVLAYTKFGKYALVIGDNETAARAMGIRVDRHRLLLYILSGTLAGLAGLLFVARVNSGDPTAGLTYELSAITAAIIGGTNLFGGRGSIFGTIVGALIMGVLQNGLNLLAVPPYYQPIATGTVLVLAVWLDQVNRARSAAA